MTQPQPGARCPRVLKMFIPTQCIKFHAMLMIIPNQANNPARLTGCRTLHVHTDVKVACQNLNKTLLSHISKLQDTAKAFQTSSKY